jgi:pyridoxal phosphate enzyme (YggS family)
MTSTGLATLGERLASVIAGIENATAAAGRAPESVTVVGVSKTVGWSEMITAYDLGLRHFGENRVLDARSKIPADKPADMVLHLIGQLQTNKASHAVDLFSVIESVDRSSLVVELQKQAERRSLCLPVLLQVNIAGEDQKAGCSPDEAEHLARQIGASPNLHLDGLMTMAPLVDDQELARPSFRGLRELRDNLEQVLGQALPTLSMGMSNDYEVAVAEGATHVRVGRAIFG